MKTCPKCFIVISTVISNLSFHEPRWVRWRETKDAHQVTVEFGQCVHEIICFLILLSLMPNAQTEQKSVCKM